MQEYICRQCAVILNLTKTARRGRAKPLCDTLRRHASTTKPRPFRLAIIGSGPAGFYSALRVLQKSDDAIVDMYEQLPTPFGLVRYGVAPDHPEVKKCQDRFAEVAESPRFNFIGNIALGKDVPLRALKPHYDAILFAYGASEDRRLGIPGEDLKGIYSARAFVGWYNGLPEYEGLSPDLQAGDTAMVIGNGNVALDIARILLSDVDALRKTDISEQAVEALLKSRIKHVNVVGRRGPMQAAFTIKEVRELMNLPKVGFEPIDQHLLPSTDWIGALPRLEQRKYRSSALLAKGSSTPSQSAPRTWALPSLLSPSSFEGSTGNSAHVKSVMCTINRYMNDSERFDASAKVEPTDHTTSLDADLVFRSIGYKSTALEGSSAELGVPFDSRTGTIPNDMYGRVISAEQGPGPLAATHISGFYCAGWVKRGPTGVIASTMTDAFASADIVLQDWHEEVTFLNGSTHSSQAGHGQGWNGVLQEEGVDGHSLRPISWQDWKRIDAEEKRRGQAKGKPREKFLSTKDMLAILD